MMKLSRALIMEGVDLMWQDYKETILKPDKTINGTTYHHTGFMFLRDNQWLYEYMSDNGKVAYIL